MRFSEIMQAASDFWRPNRYELKPYLLNDGEKHPFAVICPGGGYSMVCSFVEGKPIAEALNRKGFHAFVVYYRTRKKAGFPNPQEDLKRAVCEIIENADKWNIDLKGWSLWGSSAGGHLAASYCAEEWCQPKPAVLILSYPVVSMGEKTHPDTRRNLLGEKPDCSMIERLSAEKNVIAGFPPTFIWNGTADKDVDPANSRLLAAALKHAGIVHRAEEYEGIGHGVGLAKGTDAEVWFDHAVEFWQMNR